MLGDLDQMRAMLESVLSFLRNDRRLESMTLTDVAITLQLVPTSSAIPDARSPMTALHTPWRRRGPTICIAPSPTWWRTPRGSAPRPQSASTSQQTASSSMSRMTAPAFRKQRVRRPQHR
jgi:hypothetical protein